ncbi:ALIX V-shaped domain [Trypanosoma melophagium]|uniref:ALIX V-shaped domain n=1 Tax=Trypanosoma melophagium TaxID=715481 RepID=UPI003519F2E9|nr:ALIX V-shaped domain [Trypanosoma melophagium]
MAALVHLPDKFITLPYRRGKEDVPDWCLCLNFISINHSSNNTSSVEAALKRMNSLHKSIVQTCRNDSKVTPSESFIEHTLKPYCQLVAMAQAHLPLHKAQVHKNMMFVWRDSFDDSHKNESYNGNLELLCSIYNLAASYANVAAHQAQRAAVDDVKNAFKSFQNAAGYYEMVEQLLNRLPPEHIKGDLTSESLSLLRRICLTMTHHCAYLKAEHDMKGNHAMLAKIAREGAKQYEETASATKVSTWFGNNKKSSVVAQVEQMLSTMALIFNARAHLHLAVMREDAGEMGIAIAHYNKAQDFLSKLPKISNDDLRSCVNSIINNVNKAHEKAIASNESVHFMRVPKEVEDPSGLPRPLGKATEQNCFTSFESKRGEDPFFGIIPAHIASIASKWRDKERKLVSVCTKSCTANRNKASELFQKLGVTAVIEVLSGEARTRGKVPSQLAQKIQSLHKIEDGSTVSIVDSLVSMVKTCDELWVAANEKVKQIKSELEAEEKEDAVYLEAYGELMWRSAHLPAKEVAEYQSISAAVQEHEKGLQQWLVQPFNKAKSVVDDSLRDLARLDWPIADLDALMPFVSTNEARQQSQKMLIHVENLKKLTQRKQNIEEVQDARLRELNELIESDNVTFALSAVEANQRDVVLSKATQKIGDAIERANETMREEDKIMQELEEAVNSLGCLQSSDPVMEEMQKVCNGLENACLIYSNLRQEFSDIIRYGSSALDGLEATLSSAKSFTVCRKIEAEGLKESLDAQIAQKIAQMQQNQSSADAIEDSRRRQEELRRQIDMLERQQEQLEPNRAERMAEVLRRQKEVAAAFAEKSQQQQQQPPPPPLPSAPDAFLTSTTDEDAPPSYESVMNSNFYTQQPPPPPPAYRPL